MWKVGSRPSASRCARTAASCRWRSLAGAGPAWGGQEGSQVRIAEAARLAGGAGRAGALPASRGAARRAPAPPSRPAGRGTRGPCRLRRAGPPPSRPPAAPPTPPQSRSARGMDRLWRSPSQTGCSAVGYGGRASSSDWSPLSSGLLEGAPDGHRLAHRFHLRAEGGVHAGELFKGPARQFGYHVVDARLEGGAGAGDVVFQLVQGVAHRQQGRHLGDGEAGGLGGERGGAGNARVHLDDDHPPRGGVHRKLHVGAAGLHADDGHHAGAPDRAAAGTRGRSASWRARR